MDLLFCFLSKPVFSRLLVRRFCPSLPWFRRAFVRLRGFLAAGLAAVPGKGKGMGRGRGLGSLRGEVRCRR